MVGVVTFAPAYSRWNNPSVPMGQARVRANVDAPSVAGDVEAIITRSDCGGAMSQHRVRYHKCSIPRGLLNNMQIARDYNAASHCADGAVDTFYSRFHNAHVCHWQLAASAPSR